LAFFANKEQKFVRELQDGREKGDWVKTVGKDVSITTSQTDIIANFIDRVIRNESLDRTQRHNYAKVFEKG
jgi:hypothetical protein